MDYPFESGRRDGKWEVELVIDPEWNDDLMALTARPMGDTIIAVEFAASPMCWK